MTVEIHATHTEAGYEGEYFGTYFRGDGWERAKRAATRKEAETILRDTYLGPDAYGVGVRWDVYQAEMTDRETILAADRAELLDDVKRFFNCRVAEISDEGRVWIEGPQRGHWISDEELKRLVAALAKGF